MCAATPIGPNSGNEDVVCPACAEEVLSAFCRYMKETQEAASEIDYLDWSQGRRFWSQVNVMTERTHRCAEAWQQKLGDIAKKNAKKGKFPKEYPVLSDQDVLGRIRDLIGEVGQSKDEGVENLAPFIPFDKETEETCREKFKPPAQKVVKKVIEKVFPVDMEHIQEALHAKEGKGKGKGRLSEDETVKGCVSAMIGELKEQTKQTLHDLKGKDGEELKVLLFETAEARLRKLLAAQDDERRRQKIEQKEEKEEKEKEKEKEEKEEKEKERKKLGDGARRVVAALHRSREKDYLSDIVDCVRGKVTQRKKKKTVTPVIVLIGGGGAAGKTTFARKLASRLEARVEKVERLDLDHYFLPMELIGNRASDGKYDNPWNSDLQRVEESVAAIKRGGHVTVPFHDRNEHKLSQQSWQDGERFLHASVVIIEGLYTLGPRLESLGHVKIYIDASPLDRAKGRVWRDVNIRKRNERHVVEMLLGRETYHQTFVEPTQAVADYIVRRSSTGGVLRVVDDDEIEGCFFTACDREQVDPKKAASLFVEFLTLAERMNSRRAAQTEF